MFARVMRSWSTSILPAMRLKLGHSSGHDPILALPADAWNRPAYPSEKDARALTHDVDLVAMRASGFSETLAKALRHQGLFSSNLDQFRIMMAYLAHGDEVDFIDATGADGTRRSGVVCGVPNRATRRVPVRPNDSNDVLDVPFVALIDWFEPKDLPDERFAYFRRQWVATQEWATERYQASAVSGAVATIRNQLAMVSDTETRARLQQDLQKAERRAAALSLRDAEDQPLCVSNEVQFRWMLTHLAKGTQVWIRLPLVARAVRAEVMESFDDTVISRENAEEGDTVFVRLRYNPHPQADGVLDDVNTEDVDRVRDGKELEVPVSSIVRWEPSNETLYHYRNVLGQMTLLVIWQQLTAMRAIRGGDRVQVA